MSNKKIIEIRDAKFTYPDGTHALFGIDLDIYEGEFVGLIGQNGSGKTTLSKLINGLYKPTEGDVLVHGQNTRDLKLAKLATIVGYVFQNPDHQIFSQSIIDEVTFGPKNLYKDEELIKEYVDEALRVCGLEQRKDEYPFILSKGERQRIALASILAMHPEVLIFDEPTTGQDYRNIQEVMRLVQSLYDRSNGKLTLIIISHDMRVIAEYTKRTIAINDGYVLIDASTREVFSKPEILSKAFLQPPQITMLANKIQESHLHTFSDLPLTVDEFYSMIVEKFS